jgi:hypothetical protein
MKTVNNIDRFSAQPLLQKLSLQLKRAEIAASNRDGRCVAQIVQDETARRDENSAVLSACGHWEIARY